MKIIFGSKFSETTMAFINICIAKGREDILPEMSEEFLAINKKMKGVSTVKVTTATPLSIEVLEAIRQKLVSSSDTLKNVEIETVVNPDLIGGFVIEFDDKLYDSSVAHKLESLRKEFKGNIYESLIEKR